MFEQKHDKLLITGIIAVQITPENPDWKQRDPMLLSFFLCFWIYTVYYNTESFLIKKASIPLVAIITWNLFKYLFFYKKSICSCETTLSMIFLNNDKNKKNLVLLTSCNMFFTMNTMKIVIENFRQGFTLKKMMIFTTHIFSDFFILVWLTSERDFNFVYFPWLG